MTRSEHPSVGIRAVPNPDDAPNPEQVTRINDAKHFLDMLLDLGATAPAFNMSITLGYNTEVVDGKVRYTLGSESQALWNAADYIEVVDHHAANDGTLVYVVLNLWYGEMTVRAMCHAPEAVGVWTPPAQAVGEFTLHQRERLPLWAE